jgi:hypothetical protein
MWQVSKVLPTVMAQMCSSCTAITPGNLGPMAFFFLFFFNFVINQSGNDAQEDLARFGYNIKIIYIFSIFFG